MSTTYIPNFKKIHQFLGTQIVQKLSKTTHTKIFNCIFWKHLTIDKDENGIVELAVES